MNINIIQLKGDPSNADTNVVMPPTLSFGQHAYVIKRSMLHFGEDDFLFDLAGHYDVPRVILFSNTYPETTRPFWGSKDKERIIFHTGPFSKPSLSPDPNTNFVAGIKPEEIASKIMELLGVEWKAPYETVYVGPYYKPQHSLVELYPDLKENLTLNGSAEVLAVRMDYNFDENFLATVLQQSPATIVTEKPINLDLLSNFRGRLSSTGVMYLVNAQSDIGFAKDLSKLNLIYSLVSYESGEGLAKTKAKFFEIGVVNHLPIADPGKMKEFTSTENLHYKSAKRVVRGSKEFKSKRDLFSGFESNAEEFSPCPDMTSEDFRKELEFFFIVKKSS